MRSFVFFLFSLMVLGLAACTAPATPATSPTLVTIATLVASPIPPTATHTAAPPTATHTATFTQTATRTATNTHTPTLTSSPTNTASATHTTTASVTSIPANTPNVVPTRVVQDQSDTDVPILYVDVVESDGKFTAVTKAVDAQGKDLGIVAQAFGASQSPDGKSFAFVSSDGSELLQRTGDGQPVTLLRATADEKFRRLPIWSPDAKKIAIISRTPDANDGKEVIVVENAQAVARYKLPPLADDHLWNPNKFRWSPDGKKILVSWDYTIVIHTDANQVEMISDQRVMAEWSPNSDSVYYFDLVLTRYPSYGDLGNFNVRKLGEATPTVLMSQERVSALGLHTNVSAFFMRAQDLQFNRGLLSLSPSGRQMVLVTGLESGSRLSVYDLALDGTLTLDTPNKSVEMASSIGAVEWSPDETKLAVVAVGETQQPPVAVRVLDLKTDQWTTLAQMDFQVPSFQLMDQVNFIITISSKILSWSE